MGADPDISTQCTTDGANNFACYSDEELDALSDQAFQTPGEEDRKEIYGEIAKLVGERLPVLYLFNYETATVTDPAVHLILNVYSSTYDSYLWSVEE